MPRTEPPSSTARRSPEAATELMRLLEAGASPIDEAVDDAMGATDCEEGCQVEADGRCPHGYLSAGRSAGVI